MAAKKKVEETPEDEVFTPEEPDEELAMEAMGDMIRSATTNGVTDVK